MEFGRVSESELESIQFSLPKEPTFNQNILSGFPLADSKIYVGCTNWRRTEWIGSIYPLKTKEKDFLAQYVQQFNTIELNATYYNIYPISTIEKWANQASGRDFIFCPKMYKEVTHGSSLLNKELLVHEFLNNIQAFKQHLGPIFIQLSEAFSPKRKEELFSFLQLLPTNFQFFVEVRHTDWFSIEAIKTELFHFLKNKGIGIVITDTSNRRDCAHMHLTIPKTFIRFVGNCLHATDYTRIDEWILRIQYWLQQGMESVYFFIHMQDERYSPELTVYMIDKLNKTCGLQLAKPQFLPQQQHLF